MFFAISGYLFFRGFTLEKLISKWRRRVDTLLIPYLLWNVVYVAFMVIMSKLGLMESLTFQINVLGLTKAVLNAECSPLWFLRYLMLFVCIAPLTYYVLKNRVIGGLVIMGMIGYNILNYYSGAFDNGIDVNSNTLVMFNYQFIFFATGAYAALCWSNQVETPTQSKSYFAVAMIFILFGIYWFYLNDNGTALTNHLFRWIWIPLFWFSFDLLPQIKIKPWMRFSFFIYCSHMFVLYCVQGVTAKTYPLLGVFKPYFAFIEYIALGIITVYVLIKIITSLKIRTPKVFSLITGSRG